MALNDFEQRQLEEHNRLFSEQNSIARDLMNSQSRYQEEQLRQQEQNQIYQHEKALKDRVDDIRLKLAQTSDSFQREQLQLLLNEAITEHDNYWAEKKRQEEECQRQLAEEERRRQRRERWLVVIGSAIFLCLAIFLISIRLNKTPISSSSNKDLKAPSSTVSTSANEGDSSSSSKDNGKASSTVASASQRFTKESTASVMPQTNRVSFRVRVDVSDLQIRALPTIWNENDPFIVQEIYTIVETTQLNGVTWGKLESGAGWIRLDGTTRVEMTQPNTNQTDPNVLEIGLWAGVYDNWTGSVRYIVNEDGTGSIRTAAGELPLTIQMTKPVGELKVIGRVLSESGEPMEEKEYFVNMVLDMVDEKRTPTPLIWYPTKNRSKRTGFSRTRHSGEKRYFPQNSIIEK